MKKQFLLLAIALMALVTSCHKELTPENKLIEGIELPPLTEQFAEGSPITIKGTGFTKIDQIVFRTQTKATTDILAEIKEVGATQITFIVPPGLTAGENPIVLKRGGAEQVLGSVSIAETSDAKLYGFGWLDVNDPDDNSSTIYDNSSTIYEIDRTTGVSTVIKTLADGQNISFPVAIGHVVYGMNGSEKLVSFDFDTKMYNDFGAVANLQCMGVINNKLHVITAIRGAISLWQVNAETGALTLVADFGEIVNAETFSYIYDAPFTYDVKNKTILTIGIWQGQSQPITLNIEKKSIALLPRFTENSQDWAEFFAKGEQICVTVVTAKANDGFDFNLYTLNGKYELDKKLATIKEACTLWQYDAKADAVYGVYDYNENQEDEHGLCLFDFKTSTLNVMTKNANIYEVVLVK